MKIKRYYAADMRKAISLVRDELGPDAVIMSNQRVSNGVEVVAAIDYEESLAKGLESQSQSPYSDDHEVVQEKVAQGNIWTQDPVICEMRDEIKSLKNILNNQLSGLAWGELSRNNPIKSELLQKLSALGFSDEICRKIITENSDCRDADMAWRNALLYLAKNLHTTNDELFIKGGVHVLVGPTGAGKTTTIAKLAAQYSIEKGSNRVLLVTIDNYRVAAYEQLMVYGRIMNMPVLQIESKAELINVIEDHYDKDLILIDTAGMSQYDNRLKQQADIIDIEGVDVRSSLVIPAHMQYSGVQDVIRLFSQFGPKEIIVTKMDECTSLGGLVSSAIESELPLSYICDGQQVPEDIHKVDTHKMISRCVALNKRFRRDDKEIMAINLGRVVADAYN